MFGSSRTRTIAVASVGSGSVSVGIVERAAGKAPSIAAAERLTLSLEKRTHEQTIVGLKQRLIDAGHRALAAYAGSRTARPVSSVIAVIRAPWTQSRTVRADASYDHEEHISKTIISDLAQRALDDAHPPRANFLEASVMQVELNGYPTSDPEGKYAHKVDVAVLVCVADPSFRAALQEALGMVFPAAPVAVHSGARGIMEALRSASFKGSDCLVLDVADEGTASIIVREGVAESEAYMAEGTRSILVRAVPKRPPEVTLANIRMIAREECDPATRDEVERALATMEPDLAHVFGEFFATIVAPRRLPNTLVLLTHTDLAPWFVRFFSRIDFAQFTETSQPFQVIAFKTPNTTARERVRSELSRQGRSIHAPRGAPTTGREGEESTDIDLSLALALINKQG